MAAISTNTLLNNRDHLIILSNLMIRAGGRFESIDNSKINAFAEQNLNSIFPSGAALAHRVNAFLQQRFHITEDVLSRDSSFLYKLLPIFDHIALVEVENQPLLSRQVCMRDGTNVPITYQYLIYIICTFVKNLFGAGDVRKEFIAYEDAHHVLLTSFSFEEPHLLFLNTSQKLGAGTYGAVYKGTLLTPKGHKVVAIKFGQNLDISREANNMRFLQNSGVPIPSVYSIFKRKVTNGLAQFFKDKLPEFNNSDEFTVIAMELYQGDLSLLPADTSMIAKIAISASLLEGVLKLHSLDRVHGDLKASNILRKLADNGRISIAIGDWGTLIDLNNGEAVLKYRDFYHGHYSNPNLKRECIEARLAGDITRLRMVHKRKDIWAVAVIIFKLMTYDGTCSTAPFVTKPGPEGFMPSADLDSYRFDYLTKNCPPELCRCVDGLLRESLDVFTVLQIFQSHVKLMPKEIEFDEKMWASMKKEDSCVAMEDELPLKNGPFDDLLHSVGAKWPSAEKPLTSVMDPEVEALLANADEEDTNMPQADSIL